MRKYLSSWQFWVAMILTFVFIHSIGHAEDEVYKEKIPMYVNHLDPTGGNKDHLVIDPEGVWLGFGPEIEGAGTVWAFADYQRKMAGIKIATTISDGEVYPSCVIFEVNKVDYMRTLNHPKLRIGNAFSTTCEGVDKWIKETLK